MKRLFVAVDLPPDVRRTVAALREDIPGARWCPEEQLHLTLSFIGDADDALFDSIRDRLSTISCPSFALALAGIGSFPPRRHPRVLWVGLTSPPELTGLKKAVDHALLAAGFSPEEREFSPHITLARLKDPADTAAGRFLARNASFSAPEFVVNEFCLYSSTLTPHGAIHTPELTVPLKQ